MRRGDNPERLDARFNHPRYGLWRGRLAAAPTDTPDLGSLLLSISSGATPQRSDESLYATAGVKFFRIMNVEDGEIVERDLKHIAAGVHSGDLSRSQLESGDVLLTITGRVGSAAVVRGEHLPANINQHIARLRVDRERCRPEFLSEWLNCPAGLDLSNRGVSGGTRIALDYSAVRSIPIPLPALAEQDRLVAAMDAARWERREKLAAADGLLAGLDDFVLGELGIARPAVEGRRVFGVRLGQMADRLAPPFYAPELQTFLNQLRAHPAVSKTLRDYVAINPPADISGLDDEDVVGFIPMPAVSDGATGEYSFTERPMGEVRKGYTPFADGDILWAKITPCMQNGKSCIVEGLPNGVGFGSTEFHTLRVTAPGVSKEFVKEFISQSAVRRAAACTFSGSAGQQRVSADFLANLPFPDISLARQREIVATIEAARSQARRLRAEAEAGWTAAKGQFEKGVLG